jgi:hypothetical protein
MPDLKAMLATAKETVKNLFPDLPPLFDEDAAYIVEVARLRAVERAANYLGVDASEMAAPTCRQCSAPNGETPGCLSCASKRRFDGSAANLPSVDVRLPACAGEGGELSGGDTIEAFRRALAARGAVDKTDRR